MPYKLRKAPNRDLYWVVAEDGSKKSKDPIPLKRAKSQMRALYASMKGRGHSMSALAEMFVPPDDDYSEELVRKRNLLRKGFKSLKGSFPLQAKIAKLVRLIKDHTRKTTGVEFNVQPLIEAPSALIEIDGPRHDEISKEPIKIADIIIDFNNELRKYGRGYTLDSFIAWIERQIEIDKFVVEPRLLMHPMFEDTPINLSSLRLYKIYPIRPENIKNFEGHELERAKGRGVSPSKHKVHPLSKRGKCKENCEKCGGLIGGGIGLWSQLADEFFSYDKAAKIKNELDGVLAYNYMIRFRPKERFQIKKQILLNAIPKSRSFYRDQVAELDNKEDLHLLISNLRSKDNPTNFSTFKTRSQEQEHCEKQKTLRPYESLLSDYEPPQYR